MQPDREILVYRGNYLLQYRPYPEDSSVFIFLDKPKTLPLSSQLTILKIGIGMQFLKKSVLCIRCALEFSFLQRINNLGSFWSEFLRQFKQITITFKKHIFFTSFEFKFESLVILKSFAPGSKFFPR